MSLLPSEPDTSEAEEAEPRVIDVDSDDADDVFSALTSETARDILSELHGDPAPPAEVADRVETSLQNAQYHIEKLEDAGAIEVIDTVYSEKGREMNVYAPADRPLVIFAGDEDKTTGIKAALSRLLGSLGILALASVIVQELYGRGVLNYMTGGGGPAGDQAGEKAGGGPAAPPAAGNETTKTATGTPTGDVSSADTEYAVEDRQSVDGSLDSASNGTQTEPTSGAGGSQPTPEAPEAATETAAQTKVQTATSTSTSTEAGASATQTQAPEPTTTDAATQTTTEAVNTTVQNATDAASAGGDAVAATVGMPPGLLFFLGGATALVIGLTIWYGTQ